ncbi:MAG: hypothetical protein ACP5IA_09165 [Sediminispirochaetaceae bacterium]
MLEAAGALVERSGQRERMSMTALNGEADPAGLVFVCTENGAAFHSADFRLVENRGIKVSKDGSRILDAKVLLEDPCPFCGRRHVYHVSEIPCPFNK